MVTLHAAIHQIRGGVLAFQYWLARLPSPRDLEGRVAHISVESITLERIDHFQSWGGPCLPGVGKRGTWLEEPNTSACGLGIGEMVGSRISKIARCGPPQGIYFCIPDVAHPPTGGATLISSLVERLALRCALSPPKVLNLDATQCSSVPRYFFATLTTLCPESPFEQRLCGKVRIAVAFLKEIAARSSSRALRDSDGRLYLDRGRSCGAGYLPVPSTSPQFPRAMVLEHDKNGCNVRRSMADL